MLEVIDWQRPWLHPFRDLVQEAIMAADWKTVFNDAALKAGLQNHRGLPLQFVEQSALPPEVAYEAFISQTGGVPTRCNLHDFFNAMVWLAYPRAKAQLNALQAAEIRRRAPEQVSETSSSPGSKSAPTRGVVRDRATIFDENAAILLTIDPALEAALRAHRWHDCLLANRAAFSAGSAVCLFGHALMEKLVLPYKAITAHVWLLPTPQDFFDLDVAGRRRSIDQLLCDRLQRRLLDAPPTPLPVLGVPGWWPGQDAAFYADETVFRRKRT